MQKHPSKRVARASAVVHLGRQGFELVQHNRVKKGDVLTTAQLAGIMGAKLTSTLIPLCHSIMISKADVQLELEEREYAIRVTSEVSTVGPTGVEMEALTAVSIAALTVYDMCKAVSKEAVISDVQLQHKSGGKSGDYDRRPA
jgi:molybdenum cofactor biosynthesis protein MoaC